MTSAVMSRTRSEASLVGGDERSLAAKGTTPAKPLQHGNDES